MASLKENSLKSKAWPFEEARKVLARFQDGPPTKGHVLFQTGYGPSGLPHIGTFGEVARTNMVRKAFENISDIPTRLICFSDDMDGLRKVPGNVPNAHRMEEDIGLPLTKVRDPFGEFDSFGRHNNERLRAFLDRFGFDYDFASSTRYYAEGRFDDMLIAVLERFEDIMAIMLPSLGAVSEGRQETYSPFLPVSPKSGRVLQVPTLERNPSRGTIVYQEPDGEKIETPVTGGRVKLQWKPDWAMRWAALEVDYEMFGKDLIPSASLANKICRILKCRPPVNLSYELFLDSDGQKISKSKGNGLSIEEWLTYASPESLSLFMYQKPKTAKRLYFDIIPKTVDEYHQHLRSFEGQDDVQRLSNPVWHIHGGRPPVSKMIVPFATLLNLASVVSAEDSAVLWGFLARYAPSANSVDNPDLDNAVHCALRYYRDKVAPERMFREPDAKESAAFKDLADRLRTWKGDTDPEALQSIAFAVGREHGFDPLRDWFRSLYEVLLGASQGPRFGGFIALYGIRETAELIDRRLGG